MVKRQTIALLAAEEQVPLVLTAEAAGAGGRGSEQDATSGTQSRIACRQTAREGRGRGPDRAEAADRDGQNAR